jgi:quinoprotein glucose dehydrogenase
MLRIPKAAIAILLSLHLLPGGGPIELGAQVFPEAGEWTGYGRDPGGTGYSPLSELHPENVDALEVAWIYRTGDLLPDRGRFQSRPLMVDGRLFVSSPLGRVSALDPGTGGELWTFDPGVDLGGDYGDFANRGVAYWTGGAGARSGGPGEAGPGPCFSRVFIATIDARLLALDPERGTPCRDFGNDGQVSLTEGLRNPPTRLGEYQVTSPPAVIGDGIVVGSAIADNQRVDAPSGVVRAFHAETGRLLWSWDPVPQDPADPAHGTWGGSGPHRTGAANAWAPLSVDPELGLVFVPTSSPSPDFYGGERLGRNHYANSIVALDAGTGRVRWHFQVVRHDLWDYDIPAQPALFSFPGDGASYGDDEIPALAVATKMGHLFLLDRRTGEPIHPVEERPVPASTVPGEEAWPTQPFPVRPAPLVPRFLDPEGPLGWSREDAQWCRERLAGLRNEGIFTPPSREGTVIFPGNVGGMQWGGVAVDPVRRVGVAPTNRLPFVVTLIPAGELQEWRDRNPGAELSAQRGTPYGVMRQILMTPSGVPCAPPPWGALTAVDLVSGEHLWEVPLGALGPSGGPGVGMPNMGGALVTAGGLVFMAGTPDGTLRAFHLETGEVLWTGELPTDAMASPMTYRFQGRQYVVVAAGGHDRMRAITRAPLGDHLVAFALPDEAPPPPPPSSDDPTGSWAGEVRGGSERFVASLEFGAGGGGPAARLTLPEADLHAELQVEHGGSDLILAGTFRAEGGSCTGPVRLDADLANHGLLLVGLFHIEGPCLDGGAATGAFSFRRAP